MAPMQLWRSTIAASKETPRVDAVSFAFIAMQVIVTIIFLECASYSVNLRSTNVGAANNVGTFYGMYIDIAVMIFIGYGFMHSFMRRYGFSAIGFGLLVAAFSFEWGIICVEFWRRCLSYNWSAINVTIPVMIDGLYAATTVLVSFGAVMGKVTPLQMLIISVFELPIYALNRWIVLGHLGANDVGGCLCVHIFGAFFGIGLSFVMSRSRKWYAARDQKDPLDLSRYNSDVTAILGTLLLFIFWPSFNGAMSPGGAQLRAVINTLLALCASVCTAAIFSYTFNDGRFSMFHIQNATLAGGVMIGSPTSMVTSPGGAIGIGMIAAFVSVLGLAFLKLFMEESIYIHDSCGVFWRHGMPGLFGGLAAVISARYAETNPVFWTSVTSDLWNNGTDADIFQFYAWGISILLSFFAGVLVGELMNWLPIQGPYLYFQDKVHWELPEACESDGWALDAVQRPPDMSNMGFYGGISSDAQHSHQLSSSSSNLGKTAPSKIVDDVYVPPMDPTTAAANDFKKKSVAQREKEWKEFLENERKERARMQGSGDGNDDTKARARNAVAKQQDPNRVDEVVQDVAATGDTAAARDVALNAKGFMARRMGGL